MVISAPHYLLHSQIDRTAGTGRWRFVLRSSDGAKEFEADDVEPHVQGERLELLTVIRALESLDQPSRVTLVDCSQYVWKGVHYGLPEWRSNEWRWEFFGQMVPIKNCDLWQRMDRALRFHEVECRRRRFDPAHHPTPTPPSSSSENRGTWGPHAKLSERLKYVVSNVSKAWRNPISLFQKALRRWVTRSCRPRTACPWTI